MRPSLAQPRLSSRIQPPHHNHPRVSGYTASARTFTARCSLPGLSALETRKCVHHNQHVYQHHRQQQPYYQQQNRQRHQHRYHYPRNLSYNYGYDYEVDEEYDDDRFQRYSRLPPLRSAPGTLTFVNLLVKRFLCFLTCSPCGLHGAA